MSTMFKIFSLFSWYTILIGALFLSIHANGQETIQNAVPREPQIFAMVVGIDKYLKKNFDSLNYAAADAKKFVDYLKSGIPGKKTSDSNIFVYLNDSAKQSNIADFFSHKLTDLDIRPGDELYIYWSGHGKIGKDGQILICHDTGPSGDKPGKYYPDFTVPLLREHLKTYSNGAGIRVYLIIDACRDYWNPVDSSKQPPDDLKTCYADDEIFLSSCEIFQSSFECKDFEGGVFTHFLLSGLSGAADNIYPDGNISLKELHKYLFNNVSTYVQKRVSRNLSFPNQQDPATVAFRTRDWDRTILTSMDPVITKRRVVEADSFYSEFSRKFKVSPAGVRGITKLQPGTRINAKIARYDSTLFYVGDSLLSNFSIALQGKRLVEPEGASAFDFYRRIDSSDIDQKLKKDIKSRLFIGLLDDVNKFIGDYVDGTLHEIRNDRFNTTGRELSVALSLAPKDTILAREYSSKQIFLQSRYFAGSRNPTDWQKGLDLLRTQSPEDALIHHTRGMLFINKGRYFSALRQLDTALMFAPKWIYALYNRAQCLTRIQEYDKSIDQCIQIISLSPDYSRAYSLIGQNYAAIETLRGSGDFAKAIRWNKKALLVDSTNTSAYLNLGVAYTRIFKDRNANLKLSMQYLQKGGSFLSENCLTMIGETYESKGPAFCDSARLYYLHSLRLNRFNENTLRSYARFLINTGHPTAADSMFLKTLDTTKYDYKIYAAYRDVTFNQSVATARAMFTEIVAINSEDPQIFIEHCRQLESIDSIRAAIDVLRNGLRHINNSPSIYFAMAKLFLKHYKTDSLFYGKALDSAVHYLKLLREEVPNYAVADYNYYQLMRMLYKDKDADQFLKQAMKDDDYLRYNSGFYRELVDMGKLAAERQDYQEARDYFRTALEVSPDDFDAFLLMGKTFYMTNQFDSVKMYTNLAAKVIDLSDVEDSLRSMKIFQVQQNDRLRALAYFDLNTPKGFSRAKRFFHLRDYEFSDKAVYLEKGLCWFKMGKVGKARRFANRNKVLTIKKYLLIKSQESIDYTNNFVSSMNDFFKFLGPGFKSQHILPIQQPKTKLAIPISF